MSKFLNGEDISSNETLTSKRVVLKNDDESKIIEDSDTYSEILKLKTSGAIRLAKTISWREDNYYRSISYIKMA